jgi:protein-L-isoaspartate(D-aspartate) O-methyltransferase
MADFETLRRKMVDNQLRTSNVTDRRLLAAMGEVPRERFVPEARQGLAYADVVHQLGAGRALSSPAPFAKLLQLAEIAHTDRVLDVGAGTGYTTAVLARLGSEVTALEPDADLATAARDNLAGLGASNAYVIEAGTDGSSLAAGSYDVIVVEGALDAEPVSLLKLLADGGRLVALLRRNGAASASIYFRSGDEIGERSEFNASLPPLVAARAPEPFVF